MRHTCIIYQSPFSGQALLLFLKWQKTLFCSRVLSRRRVVQSATQGQEAVWRPHKILRLLNGPCPGVSSLQKNHIQRPQTRERTHMLRWLHKNSRFWSLLNEHWVQWGHYHLRHSRVSCSWNTAQETIWKACWLVDSGKHHIWNAGWHPTILHRQQSRVVPKDKELRAYISLLLIRLYKEIYSRTSYQGSWTETWFSRNKLNQEPSLVSQRELGIHI